MKKKYQIYKCSVELQTKKLQDLLKRGMNYLDGIDVYDPDPQLEKTFENLDEAEKYFQEKCFTSISKVMGNAVKYRAIDFYELWIEYWNDGNENNEDSDGIESHSRTPVESYSVCTYFKGNERNTEMSEMYIDEDNALEDAESMNFVDEENDYYIVKYIDGKEIDRKKINF